MIFSYSTDGRKFETATSIDQIPEEARRAVVVTDLSLSPEARQSGRYVYVADLRAPREDGTYPVAISSRYGFEAKITGTSTASGEASGGVVMYSASWCGVCKKAKRLLDQWGVRFVEKDVEASRAAQEELARKAASAGIQPSGVPVIDVGGVLLQGLDETTLKNVLVQKGFLSAR
jgi:glutaredoxin